MDKAVPSRLRRMTPGEKGCWRSHINIPEEFVFLATPRYNKLILPIE